MKTLIKFFAKKYIISLVNDSLEAVSANVDADKYLKKIAQIIEFLQVLVAKLDDKKITEEEAEEIVEKTKELFK